MVQKETYSIMVAQHTRAQIVREFEAAYERLGPAGEDDQVQLPDFATRARAIWSDAWQGSNTQTLVDEARGER